MFAAESYLKWVLNEYRIGFEESQSGLPHPGKVLNIFAVLESP